MAELELARIAGTCNDGRTCPTVYATNRDTVVVQGYVLDPGDLGGLSLPKGESAVEIPVSLLKEVARAHGK